MYQYRDLLVVDDAKSLDDQCQDILTNWEIVCEENDYHKDFVSQGEWDRWVSFRKKVDSELNEISTESVGEIYDYLVGLNGRISGARRVDVKSKWEEENRKSFEQEAREAAILKEKEERKAAPTGGLLNKLLKWR